MGLESRKTGLVLACIVLPPVPMPMFCRVFLCLQVISRLVYSDSCESGTFMECARL